MCYKVENDYAVTDVQINLPVRPKDLYFLLYGNINNFASLTASFQVFTIKPKWQTTVYSIPPTLIKLIIHRVPEKRPTLSFAVTSMCLHQNGQH